MMRAPLKNIHGMGKSRTEIYNYLSIRMSDLGNERTDAPKHPNDCCASMTVLCGATFSAGIATIPNGR